MKIKKFSDKNEKVDIDTNTQMSLTVRQEHPNDQFEDNVDNILT